MSLPAVAALFACARPITAYFFGAQWLEALPLLRLECITTTLGIVLAPAVPFLYLIIRPAVMSRLIIASAVAVWLGTLSLSGVAGYYAPSLTQIASAVVVVIIFDRLLARTVSYSLLRQAAPGLGICMIFGFAGWAIAAEFATDALRTVVLCAGVFAAALAATAAVTHRLSPRRARSVDVGAGTGGA